MENFLWMIAGAIVSAWTGIVTSRYFLFRQEMQRAREMNLRLMEKFREMNDFDNADEAEKLAVGIMQDPILALRAQGHYGISVALARRSYQSANLMMQGWRAIKGAKAKLTLRGLLDPIAITAMANTTEQAGAAVTNEMFLVDAQIIMTGGPDWLTILISAGFAMWVARVQHRYMDFTEHLETGAPILEIKKNRNAREQAEAAKFMYQ